MNRIFLTIAFAGVLLPTLNIMDSHAAGKDPQATSPSVTDEIVVTEQRVALVIGNAAYKPSPLVNSVNDAGDMAAKLAKLNFNVILKTNAGKQEMTRAITEFGEKIKQGGAVALFYYVGHGAQVKGRNYLIPIDANIKNEPDIPNESIDVEQLFKQLAPSRVSLVLFDACRTYPFRGPLGCLAPIDAPKGAFIAYATSPGKVAADDDGRNGLYTSELLKTIDTPNIKVEDIFKQVRISVAQISRDRQVPWESSALIGDFYFTKSTKTSDDFLWEAIGTDTPCEYQTYLDLYPTGKFAASARQRLKACTDDSVIKPEPVAAKPQPVTVKPEPVTAKPEPIVVKPEPVAVKPEPVAVKPEPVVVKPVTVAVKPEAKTVKTETAAPAIQSQSTDKTTEESLWEENLWNAVNTNNLCEYQRYIDQYPSGKFITLARQRLKDCKSEGIAKSEPKTGVAGVQTPPISTQPAMPYLQLVRGGAGKYILRLNGPAKYATDHVEQVSASLGCRGYADLKAQIKGLNGYRAGVGQTGGDAAGSANPDSFSFSYSGAATAGANLDVFEFACTDTPYFREDTKVIVRYARAGASVPIGMLDFDMAIVPPTAAFSVSAKYTNGAVKVEVDASSSNAPSGKALRYEWSASNDQPPGGDVTSHKSVFSFNQSGRYTITLTVTDNLFNTATITKTIDLTDLRNPVVVESNASPVQPKP